MPDQNAVQYSCLKYLSGSFLSVLLAALFLLPIPATAALDGHNASLPIEVTADRLSIVDDAQTAKFTGNVIAKQGAITLTADEMIIHRKPESKVISKNENPISLLEVKGNANLKTPTESIRGDIGTYEVNRGLVTIKGNVELRRGKNLLRGTVLTYDMNSGKSNIQGDGTDESGRVKGLFVPSSNGGQP